jgi:hypothetical protein
MPLISPIQANFNPISPSARPLRRSNSISFKMRGVSEKKTNAHPPASKYHPAHDGLLHDVAISATKSIVATLAHAVRRTNRDLCPTKGMLAGRDGAAA